jgi:hypothetical protein
MKAFIKISLCNRHHNTSPNENGRQTNKCIISLAPKLDHLSPGIDKFSQAVQNTWNNMIVIIYEST